MPQLWVVAGPNGAGKTTLVSRRLSRRIPVVNPDVIAQALPRLDGKLDERQAGETALRERSALLAEGADFAIETTLTGNSALRFIKAAKDNAYKVTMVYVGLDSSTLSASRVLDRISLGGHSVPRSAIERRYGDTMTKLGVALGIVDRSYVFDNSDRRRRLLLIRHGEQTKFLARNLPRWFVDAVSVELRGTGRG